MTRIVFACGLASCTVCDAAWWAVSEEEAGTPRLSGLECQRCGAHGRFVSPRCVAPTMEEALAAVRVMREQNMNEQGA